MLLFFTSCSSQKVEEDSVEADDKTVVEVTSEVTTEEATTEDPDLFPIEVDYEPVEYDDFPEVVDRIYIDKCYRYVTDLLYPEYIEDGGEDSNGEYGILKDDKDITELIEIDSYIEKYEKKVLRFKPDYDWAWDRSFVYGMEGSYIYRFNSKLL